MQMLRGHLHIVLYNTHCRPVGKDGTTKHHHREMRNAVLSISNLLFDRRRKYGTRRPDVEVIIDAGVGMTPVIDEREFLEFRQTHQPQKTVLSAKLKTFLWSEMDGISHEVADTFVVEGSDIGRGHKSMFGVSVHCLGREIRLNATIQHKIDFLMFSSI